MSKLDFLTQEINGLKEQGLYNNIRTIGSAQGAWLTVDGKNVLNFCSNNYLGLANHPKIVEAAKEATKKYGVGPAAVRSIAGTMDLHVQLEQRLAKFKGAEDVITPPTESRFMARSIRGAVLIAGPAMSRSCGAVSDGIAHAVLAGRFCSPASCSSTLRASGAHTRARISLPSGVTPVRIVLIKSSSVQDGRAEPPPKVRLGAGGQLDGKPGMGPPDIVSP